ncbi:MAG: radical SAM protein [Selenomonas sp.]|uniref:radical SAM protein n=1 Tax=Selenomonas sp. TaxID=2053611 RepID=UPI0025E96F9C|nr:radical SAM protein [Selenomonas sp.]MCR5758594.1 radical SAM protein [Selenomonas sp.]
MYADRNSSPLGDELKNYIAQYDEIQKEYQRDLASLGVPLAEEEETALTDFLAQLPVGVQTDNDGKSIFYGKRSPACEACRQGDKSVTFYLSLQCHHHCFYCFNPNQEQYEEYQHKTMDVVGQLQQLHKQRRKLSHIALSGGEPLLFPDRCLEVFKAARRLYPKAHLRLYTSGDLLTTSLSQQLAEAGLDEVRISIKPETDSANQEKAIQGIEHALAHIPIVLVEMPVFPGKLSWMKNLLLRLDELGVQGINLLELCFPFVQAEAFRQQGYQLKNPVARIIYDYWYAGGAAIAGSEAEALALVRFAAEQNLHLAVHYCSLENKHTAQIYEQNHAAADDKFLYFSSRDFFLKTAKCFGQDADKALAVLGSEKCRSIPHGIEFSLRQLDKLPDDLQVAIASHVIERRGKELFLRELHVKPVDLCEIKADEHWLQKL